MSKKKTRKAKHKAKVRELEELKLKALELESKIIEQKKENFKQLNIRNLKGLANTCNFLAPFVISAGLTVGGFNLFGGGLPFKLDKITKYKVYNMDYQTDGDIEIDEKYQTNRWFDSSLPSNTLIVHTPWEKQDEKYVRFKREYNITNLTTLNLFNAVLNEDSSYILQNLEDYKEEKQVVNELNPKEDNDYIIEASLHMLDEKDILKYNETDLKNIVISIVELILGLGIGGAFAYFRKFNYLHELKEANRVYSYNISIIKTMKQELKDINQKILSLELKGDK